MGSQYAYAPKTPPGVSIEANAQEARNYAENHSQKELYEWFYNKVRNGGPWDYKQLSSDYEDFGNYHYGVVGTAAGIPEQVLLRAAGWAQYRAGTSELGWGTYFSFPPYGDDPKDQEQIKAGIRDSIYFNNDAIKLDGSTLNIGSHSGGGGPAPNPEMWREREQTIKNHIPLNSNRDAMEEYYKQAKELLTKEGGWSSYMDIAIAKSMIKQEYDEKKIRDAMKSISPCAPGTSDERSQAYSNYTMDTARKSLVVEATTQTVTPAAVSQSDQAKNDSPIKEQAEKIDNTTKIDEIKNSSQAVNDLPRNPHSKDLFNAYAKEALDKGGQGWTADTNKLIAENMLKNGVRPHRIEEALKHSPEPVENAYYFVKDIKNSPEVQQVQQSVGMRR